MQRCRWVLGRRRGNHTGKDSHRGDDYRGSTELDIRGAIIVGEAFLGVIPTPVVTACDLPYHRDFDDPGSAMTQKATRLAPNGTTLRELFLKSGNLCAFPGCTHLMMDHAGVFIGNLCHIEAAETGGQRFNAAMTNEERRAPANLMLMCHAHHKVTDDVTKYPVAILRKYKADHESRFSSPDRAILATLKDWTTVAEVRPPENLRRANRVLGWKNSDADLAVTVLSVGRYIEALSRVPMEVRSFLGKVVQRAHRLGDAPATGTRGGLLVACYDIENAFRMSAGALTKQATQLALYKVGGLSDLDVGDRVVPAILIRDHDGWPFWPEMATFCEAESVSLDTLTELLDFSSLDETT